MTAQRRNTTTVSNAAASAASSGGDTAAALQELLGNVDQATQQAEQRLSLPELDVLGTIDKVQAELDEAAKIANEEDRRVRIRVLHSTLEALRDRMPQDDRDLVNAVFNLSKSLEAIGDQFANLGEITPGGQRLIDNASAAVKEAEAGVEKAKSAWIFKGSKTVEARAILDAAQKSVETATQQAQEMARAHLREANPEEALQAFLVRAEKTKGIIHDRCKAIRTMINTVTARKGEAFKLKGQAAEALELLSKQRAQMEEELKQEELKLNALVSGTAEQAEQSQKVSEIRTELLNVVGRHDKAVGIFHSKEAAAESHEIILTGLQKQFTNLTVAEAVLQSDVEERVVSFRAWIVAKQGAADQDASRKIHKVGREIDRRIVEDCATMGAVADRVTLERAEEQPELMKDIARVGAAQAEASADARRRFLRVLDDLRNQHGLDPTRRSLFSYEGKEDAPSTGEPAPERF